jgi:hypothetical protein
VKRSVQKEDSLMITILDPTAPPPGERAPLPRPLMRLEGAVLAVLTNRWKSMDLIAERFAQRLPADYGVADVLIAPIPLASGAPESLLDSIAARAQGAVVGLAN